MKPRFWPALLLVLATTLASAADGDRRFDPRTDPRYVELETEYNRVDREQQAAYQQFMMAQELRRNALQDDLPSAGFGPTYQAPGGLTPQRSLDYDENLRRKRELQDRLYQLERDITDSYNRYTQLGQRKQALQDQMRSLLQQR